MTADLPRAVTTVFDAVAAQDTTAFLAAFTPATGAVDDWGRVFAGEDAIRGWSDGELIGKRATFEVTGVERDGDAYVVAVQVGGDGFTGPSTLTFDVGDGTVDRMTIRA